MFQIVDENTPRIKLNKKRKLPQLSKSLNSHIISFKD